MRVLVASTNPNKLAGTERAFAEFPEVFGESSEVTVVGKKFQSGVRDQPIGYEEAIRGAFNRAESARKSDKKGEYDFYVGIEASIVFVKNYPHLVTYACVMSKGGSYYFGSSKLHPLPAKVVESLAIGQELAAFAEKISGVKDVRSKGGIAGYLFKGTYTRTDVNYLAVKGALAGFIRVGDFKDSVDFSKLPKSVYVSVSIAGGIVKDLPLQLMEWIEQTGAVVNDKHVVYAGHDQAARENFIRQYAAEFFGIKAPREGEPGFDELIYKLDTYLVDEATHMIVVLEKPSHGVGMEIERALSRPARGLPTAKILGLVKDLKFLKLSRMVRGAAEKYNNFVLRTYKTEGEIKDLVIEFLTE